MPNAWLEGVEEVVDSCWKVLTPFTVECGGESRGGLFRASWGKSFGKAIGRRMLGMARGSCQFFSGVLRSESRCSSVQGFSDFIIIALARPRAVCYPPLTSRALLPSRYRSSQPRGENPVSLACLHWQAISPKQRRSLLDPRPLLALRQRHEGHLQ